MINSGMVVNQVPMLDKMDRPRPMDRGLERAVRLDVVVSGCIKTKDIGGVQDK